MASDRDPIIDQVFIDLLVKHGYLRCGPSRAYVEFEAVIEQYEALLRLERVQIEFHDLCRRCSDDTTMSKIDYQDATDPRGHKLSLQLEYNEAEAIIWDRYRVRPEFLDIAAAVVRLVRHDLSRSPIRLLTDQPERRRSTVRAIVYYPGEHPGVGWHTDGCLAQFISVPIGDTSLYIAPRLPDGPLCPEATVIAGGLAPETILLLGRQAAVLRVGATATPHAVASVSARRAVATHFVWVREDIGPAHHIELLGA